jgi:hypothetical protein
MKVSVKTAAIIGLFLLLLAQVLAGCAKPAESPRTTPPPTTSGQAATAPPSTLTAAELKKKMDSGSKFALVDVRPLASYDAIHIGTAVSIPVKELEKRYGEITAGLDVVVYTGCQ